MSIAEDIAIITRQESLLQWDAFGPREAEAIGEALRAELLFRDLGATVEVELKGKVLFHCATPGATATQPDWIRRKRNVVTRWQRSSYVVGRILERDGHTMQEHHGLPEKDFAVHGGGFPITVRTRGCVGSVVLSGLPQREDHEMVVAAMAKVAGVEVPRLS